MEELLNKLIEKGWKPRGENVELYGTSKNTFGEKIVIFIGNAGGFKKWGGTYRELVSKESGLWQFVCENYLIELNGDEIQKKYKSEGKYPLRYEKHYGVYHSDLCTLDFMKYETPDFWIIESALCNEEDLEKFLLNNIKV